MYVLLWLLILLVVGLVGFGIYAKLGSYRKEIKDLRADKKTLGQKIKAKRDLMERIREQLRNAPLDDVTAELIRREFQSYEREMH